MKSEGQTHAKRSSDVASPAPRALSAYVPPRVERLGDLRDLTFGPSPGLGDSGPEPNRKVAGT
jgi:hypothetical protein